MLTVASLVLPTQIPQDFLCWALVVAALLLGALAGRLANAKITLRKKDLLTKNETEFFARLCRALPEHHVFPQVAFGAILDTPRNMKARERLRSRNSFDRKIADFVICKKQNLEIIAVIELDDRTHNAAKDAKRDALLTGAGYRIIRYRSTKKPSEADIARDIAADPTRPQP